VDREHRRYGWQVRLLKVDALWLLSSQGLNPQDRVAPNDLAYRSDIRCSSHRNISDRLPHRLRDWDHYRAIDQIRALGGDGLTPESTSGRSSV
jgi:hypothetical protein